MEAGLIDVLGQQDSDVRVQRSLEPEWLVVEALFSSSHAQYDETNPLESKAFTMLVGGIAKTINQRMSERVEEVRLTAKKTGLVLRALGIRTKCLGKYGRGIEFHAAMREKVHELSKQFGITRRDLLSLVGDEPEYGGAPCELCEKYGVTGGLEICPPSGTETCNSEKPPPYVIRREVGHDVHEGKLAPAELRCGLNNVFTAA
jgi:hypothetical protein